MTSDAFTCSAMNIVPPVSIVLIVSNLMVTTCMALITDADCIR